MNDTTIDRTAGPEAEKSDLDTSISDRTDVESIHEGEDQAEAEIFEGGVSDEEEGADEVDDEEDDDDEQDDADEADDDEEDEDDDEEDEDDVDDEEEEDDADEP